MTHDIFLFRGSSHKLDLSIFAEDIPIVISNSFIEKITQKKPEFLGLDISFEKAESLYRYIKSLDSLIRGVILPIKYRNEKPKISLEDARKIAEDALPKVLARFPDVNFEPMSCNGEEFIWYVFYCSAPQWQDEGIIPGAVFINVDRWDVHIWTYQELDELYGYNK